MKLSQRNQPTNQPVGSRSEAPQNPETKKPETKKVDAVAQDVIKVLAQLSKLKLENENIEKDVEKMSTALITVVKSLKGVRISEAQATAVKSIGDSGIFKLLGEIIKVQPAAYTLDHIDSAINALSYVVRNTDFKAISDNVAHYEAIGKLNSSGIIDLIKNLQGDIDIDEDGIKQAVHSIKYILEALRDINTVDLGGLKGIGDTFNMIKSIKEIEFDTKMVIKLWLMLKTTDVLIEQFKRWENIELKHINIGAATKLASDLKGIQVSPGIFLSIITIRLALVALRRLMNYAGEVVMNQKPVTVLGGTVMSLLGIINAIAEAKINGKFIKNLIILKRSFERLKSVIESISQISIDPQAMKNLNKALKPAVEIVAAMVGLMKTLMLAVPIALLFLTISPVIILVFGLVGKVISLLGRVIVMSIQLMPKKSLIQFNLLITGLIGVNLMLLLLALSGVYLLKSSLVIVGTLLLMTLFIGLLSLFMSGVGLLVPFLIPGIVAIGLVTLAILSIVLMMVSLMFIGSMELDTTRIRDNIALCLDVCREIMETISLGDILDASVVAVAMTAMAVGVLGILLIASWLRLIQELDLDEGKIRDNTMLVVNICSDIIGILYGDEEKGQDAGILGSILSYLGTRVGKMVDALGAMVMFVNMALAVAAILLIAGMVRLIAGLDREKLQTGRDVAVDIVVICGEIMNILYGDRAMPERGDRPEGIDSVMGDKFPSFWMTLAGLAKLIPIVLSIGVIMMLGLMLRGIAAMDDKSTEAKAKVESLMWNVSQIMEALFDPQNPEVKQPEDKGFFESITDFVGDFVGGAANMARLLAKLGELGMMLAALKTVEGVADILSRLSGMDTGGIGTAAANTSILMSGVKSVMTSLLSTDMGVIDTGKMAILGKSMKQFVDVVQQLTLGSVWLKKLQEQRLDKTLLITQIEAIKSIQIPRIASNGIDRLLDISKKLVTISGNASRTNIEFLATSFGEIGKADAKNIDQITTSYGKFLDKVNSSDATKLKSTENMMKSWAALSRSISGNFDGLARALNEHILPALKELNDTMDNVMETLEAANTQRAEIYADQAGVKGDTNKIAAQPVQPTPDATTNDTTRRVREAQSKLRQAQLNASSVADILLSGEAIVRIKQ